MNILDCGGGGVHDLFCDAGISGIEEVKGLVEFEVGVIRN